MHILLFKYFYADKNTKDDIVQRLKTSMKTKEDSTMTECALSTYTGVEGYQNGQEARPPSKSIKAASLVSAKPKRRVKRIAEVIYSPPFLLNVLRTLLLINAPCQASKICLCHKKYTFHPTLSFGKLDCNGEDI